MASQYDIALKIAGKVDPSLIQSSKKASGLISSIVKAEVITAGIKTAASAVKNFAVDSIKSYAGFEQSLANAGAIAGATGEDLQAMKKAAMEAGRTTQFTAAQSADALGYMALAGWDTKTSIQALQPVLKMAQATGADLATTSDQVTDSMSAMGIPVSELNGYLDVLVQTNNKANTTAAQLMEAMIGAGSASKAAGLDYKQTATALGVLANNGIKGSEAGTALNSMLSRMTSNKAAIDMYKKLGVNVFDAKGKIRDFETILRETDTALSKLSDEKRAEAIKDIAGVNYGGQYQFLLKGVRAASDGSSEWSKLAENINNAKGALNTMNDRTTATLTGAWARFQSAIDGARLALLDKFGPQITEALDYISNNVFPPLTDAIGAVSSVIVKVISTAREFADIIFGVGESASSASGYTQGFGKHLKFIEKYGYNVYIAIQKVKEIVRSLAEGFSWITDVKSRMQDLNNLINKHKDALTYAGIALSGLGAAILAYKAKAIAGAIAQGAYTLAVGLYTGTVSIATIATSAFGAVMAFITSPITLVVGAIAALIAGMVYLYKNNETVRNAVDRLWSAMKNLYDIIAGYVIQAFNAIKPVVMQVYNTLAPFLEFVRGALLQGLLQSFNMIKGFICGAFYSIGPLVTSVIQVFTGLIDFITGVFTGNWSQAWQGIVDVFGGIFKTIGNIAIVPLNAIIGLINSAIDGMNQIKIPDWVPGVGGEGINIPHIPQLALATGGIATKPTNALIGEGGESEAVLPLSKLDALLRRERGYASDNIAQYLKSDSTPIAQNYGGDNITFSPVINVTSGGADEVKSAVSEAFKEFKRMYEQLKRDERRRSFSGY